MTMQIDRHEAGRRGARATGHVTNAPLPAASAHRDGGDAPPAGRTFGRRALWFVGLWCAGVLAVAAVALFFKLLVRAV
ncbi:DUF2474 family protein [Chitinasiproducens palmae]|uniref:DUF2474 domain-containing protein n=1 Tax=Chitinasiproducens palmae TaxID=1770053 RepID=A0A1H2PJ50_9BURK|nr:DUF2474 family protein [Chitinasiproducens palmae]SDV46312.1 Protein of unknown function [Chitinasiproducens palmae]